MAGFADIATAHAQAQANSFDYDAVRELILDGGLDKDNGKLIWSLMDHAQNLEAKLCAATKPAPAPVKRAPRGSSVGARNAARAGMDENSVASFAATTDENVATPDTTNPFN